LFNLGKTKLSKDFPLQNKTNKYNLPLENRTMMEERLWGKEYKVHKNDSAQRAYDSSHFTILVDLS